MTPERPSAHRSLSPDQASSTVEPEEATRHAAGTIERARAVYTHVGRELAIAAYRPKRSTDELLRLLGEDLATLRRRGHVTDRPAPVACTQNGELLVALEWSSEHAVADAHADPEVLAVWERKTLVADYIAPDAVAGADIPFARWPVVTDL